MAEVLGTLAAVVERLGAIVEPIVPTSIAKLSAYLEEGRAAGRLSQPSPIFPRLELSAEEAGA
jgi:methionyl-tRNA synthetase